jgi:formamidopyrimidine-DNA glycosylase
MPELPEVETIRQDLATFVVGKTISHSVVYDTRALEGFGPDVSRRRQVFPKAFSDRLAGRVVRDVARRGKYLLFHLDDGASLLSHLRMTGQLIMGPPLPNARVVIHFRETKESLNYCDVRRFGELWIVKDWRKEAALATLGPEPLEILDAEAWGRNLRRSSAKLQSALLDQKRIAGLGNIYVTEALFRTGLRPTRRARTVKIDHVLALLGNVRAVLKEGLAHRGVSFRDYRDARGQQGHGRDRLAVYGKRGEPCPQCRVLLKWVKINGRGTVYCPTCQK